MNVRRASLLDGARSATGVAVVIDVFRAFTTAAFCIAAGAREIVLVGSVEEAFAHKRANPDVFVTGEVGGRPVEGFDAPNSPTAIEAMDLRGRRVIQRSSSGTQGVIAAARADEIVLGSLVIASATARHVASRGRDVTLVAMGDRGEVVCVEDEVCAVHLGELLRGGAPDHAATVAALRLDREWPWWFPRRDAELAAQVDRFDFALPVAREDGLLIARPAAPTA